MPKKWTGKIVGELHCSKISQAELATELGVSAPYVSMVLSGKYNPPGIEEKMKSAIERIKNRKAVQS